MAQPSEQRGNLNPAEPPAGASSFERVVDLPDESAPPQSGGAPGISENAVDRPYYRPLLQAVCKGDWESANTIFRDHPNSKTAILTNKSETVLHIAASHAQDQFVENLIKLLSGEELEKVDCHGYTALHVAVLCGRIRIVKALVKSNPTLTQLQDKEGRVPFNLSAREAAVHKEVAWFLAKNTTDHGPSDPFSSPDAMTSMMTSILALTYAGHHDIVLHLVEKYPRFILMEGQEETDDPEETDDDDPEETDDPDPEETDHRTILRVLASMPSHFLSGTRLSVLEALIYKCIPVDVNYNLRDENSGNMQKSTDPALQCLMSSFWNAAKFVVPSIKRIHDMKLRHLAANELAKQVCTALLSEKSPTEITQFFQHRNLLGQATINGIGELVKLCIQFFPELAWISAYGTSLMTLAVAHRQERTLRLFLKESSSSGLTFTTAESTNGLAFAPAPSLSESRDIMLSMTQYDPNFVAADVSGPAFLMQRQLQWFKAVESWVTPYLRTALVPGDDEETYWQSFVKNHEKSLENGKKWVKDTADKCMLVSTLIATVLFAAAFTVPGTNTDRMEVPLKGSVLVFAIFDGLGLLSSVTATLLFLAILISQNEPLDFLHSLPKKIIMGFSSLFLSLAFMLVAFAATLTIVLDETLKWVVIPITLLTSLPLFLFVVQQLPLLLQMVKSTYGASIFRSEGIWN